MASNSEGAQSKVFHQISEETHQPGSKVTIVGVGLLRQVGMACAYAILNQVRILLALATGLLNYFTSNATCYSLNMNVSLFYVIP